MAVEAEEVSRAVGAFGLIEASILLLTCDVPFEEIDGPELSPKTEASSSVGFVCACEGTSGCKRQPFDCDCICRCDYGIPPHGESPSPSKSMIAN
jgi:hypothetical protein